MSQYVFLRDSVAAVESSFATYCLSLADGGFPVCAAGIGSTVDDTGTGRLGDAGGGCKVCIYIRKNLKP